MKPANVCWSDEHSRDASKVFLIDLEFIGQRGDGRGGFRGSPLYAGTQHLRLHRCSRGDDLDALGQMVALWAGYELPWAHMQIEPGNRDSYEELASAKDVTKWGSLSSAPAGSLGSRLIKFIAAARALPPDGEDGGDEDVDYTRFEELLVSG